MMPLIIDGHNLIASLPEIALEDPEDEAKLIELLRVFSTRVGKQIFLYFDRRTPGSMDPPAQGGVHVHFVPSRLTADEAIARHLISLGSRAQNWTVVSSDREIMRAAKKAGAQAVSSRAFSRRLRATLDPVDEKDAKPETELSPEELDYWLNLFSKDQ
jgi:predicted RNA-binding protein with PIN domain